MREETKKPFFVVWCPKKSAPIFRHATLALAEHEAERLARLNPGMEFFVLGTVSSRQVTDMVRVRFNGVDLPF
jgi:hypothetical protein